MIFGIALVIAVVALLLLIRNWINNMDLVKMAKSLPPLDFEECVKRHIAMRSKDEDKQP